MTRIRHALTAVLAEQYGANAPEIEHRAARLLQTFNRTNNERGGMTP